MATWRRISFWLESWSRSGLINLKILRDNDINNNNKIISRHCSQTVRLNGVKKRQHQRTLHLTRQSRGHLKNRSPTLISSPGRTVCERPNFFARATAADQAVGHSNFPPKFRTFLFILTAVWHSHTSERAHAYGEEREREAERERECVCVSSG